MAQGRKIAVVPNQVFVGLPWRNVRPRYERCIDQLERKYPLHFTIVGRKDAQDAEDLLAVIKNRMDSSSYGIFDATGGNANVSLEHGYAEAVDLPRAIYLSTHKAAASASGTIISDLGGKRRVEYTNEQALLARLEAFAKNHDYTKRFEAFLAKRLRTRKKGQKKRQRTLALKMVHYLDGRAQSRRADLVHGVQADGYSSTEVEDMIKKLRAAGLLNVSRGRVAKVRVA
jgi:hypothetical protein